MPCVTAALLLVARTYQRQFSLAHPTATAILEVTGATKSRAYELTHELRAVLPTLARPTGRPPAASSDPVRPEPAVELTRGVLRLIMDNPGCVDGPPTRRSYADVFRRRILELREAHASLDIDTFAEAVAVPRGTIEDWLRAGHPASDEPNADEADIADDQGPSSARIQSILAANKRWRGSFTAFCDHVRHHLRIPYGRTLIGRILYVHGERRPKGRPGRTPDECATRNSFEVFFPGTQWVGDGMEVPVEINDARFTFNLELDVDAYSGAIVGASVRDTEDSQAVIEAFDDGVDTTGSAPLGLLLDWRPSNHTDEVDAALGDTLRMRATKGRAQNKAHVEGAFGLFAQAAPPLAVHATSAYELAKAFLEQRVQTWARALNHRPRADRNGMSRVDIYREAAPSDEEVLRARRALEERCRKQEKATATLEARADPIVRQALDAAFERLGLVDPDEHIRLATAGYPRDAVLDGIAIFEGKRNAGTLPEGVDARYLLGIIRNLTHTHESDAITQALIRERLAARDRLLTELEHQRDELLAANPNPHQALPCLIDRALAADRTVDRLFWLHAAGDRLVAQPEAQQPRLFRSVARRIHATFVIPRRERYAAERILLRHVWPVT